MNPNKSEILTVNVGGRFKYDKSFVISSWRDIARKLEELSTEITRLENGKDIHVRKNN